MSEFRKDYAILRKRIIELGKTGLTTDQALTQLLQEGISFNSRIYSTLNYPSSEVNFITKIILKLGQEHLDKKTHSTTQLIAEKIDLCILDFDILLSLQDSNIISENDVTMCITDEDEENIVDLCKCITNYNNDGVIILGSIEYKSFVNDTTCDTIC